MGKGKGDRDKTLDILPYGVVFDVDIQPLNEDNGDPIPPDDNAWERVTRCFVYGKSEKNKLMSLKLSNLPYKRWYLRFEPHVDAPVGIDDTNTVRLDNTGVFQASSSELSVKQDNTPIIITCERNGEGLNTEFIDDTIRENYDKRTASSERGAPVKIVSVSEGIDPAALNADITYEKIAMVGVKIKASDRINSAPDLGLFIDEGREIRHHLFYGVSESDGTNMTDTANDFLTEADLNAGASYIRNLETGDQDLVTGVTNNNIISAVNFNTGDRYILFNIQSSSYFPDIFVDALINPDGGLGSLVDGDEYIDYESIVEASRFAKTNNFYWDGVLENPEEFSTWAAEQASFSRMLPLRVDGKYGLIVEEPGLPLRAVFNESNIIKDSYLEETVPWQENDFNQVVLTITNGNDLQRPVTAVTARTQDLHNGLAKLNTFNVDALSITDIEQAKNVAGVFLNQKRYQDRAVKFRTALQGIYLRPGDLVMIQHQVTEFDFEVSGYVTAVDTYDGVNFTQKFALSRQFPSPGNETGYVMTLQLQSTGEVIEGINFTGVVEFGEPFLQPANGTIPSPISVGDPVLIGKTSTVNRKYRVQSLSRGEDGSIEISCIIWDESIFDTSNLIILTE